MVRISYIWVVTSTYWFFFSSVSSFFFFSTWGMLVLKKSGLRVLTT